MSILIWSILLICGGSTAALLVLLYSELRGEPSAPASVSNESTDGRDALPDEIGTLSQNSADSALSRKGHFDGHV
jgi:hypothetical protein